MRTIARIDIKNNHVIKGINLEGLRKIGDPNKIIKNYYEEGIDEFLILTQWQVYMEEIIYLI